MADTAPTETPDRPEAYGDLLESYRRVTNLNTAGGVLQWDQEVMMPPGGTPARAKQRSTLSALSHEILTGDEVADALETLDQSSLDPAAAANVREIRRQHERAARVPSDLVEEISETSSEAFEVWQGAKEESDWSRFEPIFADLLDLKQQYAAHIDDTRDPYAVLFEDFEPYLGIDTAERVLDRLARELPPLIDDVRASNADLADPFEGTYDPDAQEALSRELLSDLDYDWDRGRLDRAPHPFSTGTQFDARVTSRYRDEDPLDGIMATVHEFGHASYTQGLPEDAYGTPLGESRDLSVHESQSRFWENHVGRTEAFWDRHVSTMREHLGGPADATARDLYEAANQVYEDNTIRVEADELTYHMHIVLRFEIERDLLRGDLDVSAVPRVWNDKMEQYLGIVPEDDAAGCLQDIHWSHGSIGYFPTYTLGSVLAAQLDHHLRADLGDVDAMVRDGEFGPLREWQREHVHRHGCRYTTPDLVREATGEDYTADYFLDHVESKFGDLYDLSARQPTG
ncbi:MAG: carboxypeptidase M32 [Halobacteriaceae archaeon]